MNIGQALQAARALGVARLDAQLLLAQLLQQRREWLLAHEEHTLTSQQEAELLALLRRRAAGEPLAYLVGEREFFGLTLKVSPAVLVPRPETEGLVEWALQCLRPEAPGAEVLDLGTGSGAIALALKHARPDWHVTATDASAAALQVARTNATRLGLAVDFVPGDWWAPLPGRRFDLVVSNPPYVAGADPHLAALTHEPLAALTPETNSANDGLGALRRIITGAPAHLRPGAWLLLEHGHDQAEAVRALLAEQGFEQAQTRTDLAGLPRCSGGRRPAAQ